MGVCSGLWWDVGACWSLGSCGVRGLVGVPGLVTFDPACAGAVTGLSLEDWVRTCGLGGLCTCSFGSFLMGGGVEGKVEEEEEDGWLI